jgi:hypothetical protein
MPRPSQLDPGIDSCAYYLQATACAGATPLAEAAEHLQFLTLLEQVRAVFQARAYAYGLRDQAVHLVLALRPHRDDSEQGLRDRWRRLSHRTPPPIGRLRQRLSSVSGFMQTMLQRFARDWNARRRRTGSMWSRRFRAVVLADDCALLAATTWIERRAGASSSRGQHDLGAPVALSSPPLRVGPGDFICPTDDAPPGCSPPPAGESDRCLERFAQTVSSPSLEAYGRALAQGWALGRAESLTGVLARLGRGGGRGRGRRLRDLGDELGLCGVWG